MTTDLFSTVLWADGAEVDPDGLNNGQRYIQASVTDQILEKIAGAVSVTAKDPEFGGQNGTDLPLTRAFALHAGGAYLRQGSANHKIQIAPGTLLQKIAVADGAKSSLVMYTFTGVEEWTLTAGDATNPRVDVLQMKLDYIDDTPASVDFQDAVTRAITTNVAANTRHRVRCTLSVKAGTPAVSPQIPEPDAGFVPVGTVVVGNTWAIGGNAPIFGIDTAATGNLVVHDQRIPLTICPWQTDPTSFWLVAAGWTLNGEGSTISAPAGSAQIMAPYRGPLGRLMAFAVQKISGTYPDGTTDLGRVLIAGATPSAGYVRQNTISLSATSPMDEVIPFHVFEASHNPAAGPIVQQSTTSKIGVPLWTNGLRCPFEIVRIPAQLGGQPLRLRLLYRHIRGATSTHVLGGVTFYVAAGM